jgi:hypothetical protein
MTWFVALTVESCIASYCTPAPTAYFSSLIFMFCSSGAVPIGASPNTKHTSTIGMGSTSDSAPGPKSTSSTTSQPSSGVGREWIPLLSGMAGLGLCAVALVL